MRQTDSPHRALPLAGYVCMGTWGPISDDLPWGPPDDPRARGQPAGLQRPCNGCEYLIHTYFSYVLHFYTFTLLTPSLPPSPAHPDTQIRKSDQSRSAAADLRNATGHLPRKLHRIRAQPRRRPARRAGQVG